VFRLRNQLDQARGQMPPMSRDAQKKKDEVFFATEVARDMAGRFGPAAPGQVDMKGKFGL